MVLKEGQVPADVVAEHIKLWQELEQLMGLGASEAALDHARTAIYEHAQEQGLPGVRSDSWLEIERQRFDNPMSDEDKADQRYYSNVMGG